MLSIWETQEVSIPYTIYKMGANKNIRHVELLAPAKDLESGIASINHGADAVYIGGPKYGARSAASNSIKDISSLIKYAHRYRVKVYIALNTILFDHELSEALSIVKSFYENGADALIIQDMGLLELELPPIPLFASTQVHNYSLEKIQFLQKAGFQRVILARELSLSQLQEIHKNTSMELEYFIHGALCVSFSGRCYLSHATQGRSSNRGECAQPCRLQYTLLDGKGNCIARDKHLLSLKDLNLSDHIGKLIDTGISSFKIEGRLKDINYVKNVTAYYRKLIDGIIEEGSSVKRTSSGKTLIVFQPDPSKTFNRGFTEYFICRRNKDILSIDSPKSVGALLGIVTEAKNDHFLLNTDETIHTGDGICFYGKKGLLNGTNINKISGKRIYPSDMKGIGTGTSVYRNYDHAFAKILRADSTKRLISVKMRFEESDDGFILYLEDEDEVCSKVEYKVKKIFARNTETAKRAIGKQLAKLGGSIYLCKEINIKWKNPCIVSLSLCNRLRRDAVAALDEERLRLYPRREVQITPNNEIYPEPTLDYSSNISNKKAEEFYFRHGVKKLDRAFELQDKLENGALMTMKHCLRFHYGICGGEGSSNADPLYLRDKDNRYRLEFDCENCCVKLVFEKNNTVR